jgi:hypothetical protein
MRRMLLLFSLIALPAWAQDEPAEAASEASDAVDSAVAETDEIVAQAPQPGGVKTMSGMSILGNEEAPKSLVIVPWKSSRLGDGVGVANALDQTPRAVDKEVFMRELHYYDLRAGGAE